MFQRLALALVVLFTCYPSMSVMGNSQTVAPFGHPLIQKFDVWGTLPPRQQTPFVQRMGEWFVHDHQRPGNVGPRTLS